jgi:hypothetical protein
MFSRREILFEGALALVSTGIVCACEAKASRLSLASCCLIDDAEFCRSHLHHAEIRMYISGDEPMIMSSGDPDFDFALARTLAKCGKYFGVNAGFAFYDDAGLMNAYATPRSRLKGTDGTVLFGQNLFRKLMAGSTDPDVSIAAVCAHEFAHLAQHKMGIFEELKGAQPTIKRIELHADFLSGYFAGRRRKERPKFPASVVTATIGSLGDDLRSSPNHHGTPRERKAAVVQGFKVAFEQNQNFAEAVRVGMEWVSRV